MIEISPISIVTQASNKSGAQNLHHTITKTKYMDDNIEPIYSKTLKQFQSFRSNFHATKLEKSQPHA